MKNRVTKAIFGCTLAASMMLSTVLPAFAAELDPTVTSNATVDATLTVTEEQLLGYKTTVTIPANCVLSYSNNMYSNTVLMTSSKGLLADAKKGILVSVDMPTKYYDQSSDYSDAGYNFIINEDNYIRGLGTKSADKTKGNTFFNSLDVFAGTLASNCRITSLVIDKGCITRVGTFKIPLKYHISLEDSVPAYVGSPTAGSTAVTVTDTSGTEVAIGDLKPATNYNVKFPMGTDIKSCKIYGMVGDNAGSVVAYAIENSMHDSGSGANVQLNLGITVPTKIVVYACTDYYSDVVKESYTLE